MNETQIISKINEFLLFTTRLLSGWLGKRLPKLTPNWFTQVHIAEIQEILKLVEDN